MFDKVRFETQGDFHSGSRRRKEKNINHQRGARGGWGREADSFQRTEGPKLRVASLVKPEWGGERVWEGAR